MGDIMRPIPFEELLTRIFDEYQQQRSIFGIPEQQFYSPVKGKTVSVFGETCATPVGPAAGPHTQLAQNIVTSWLTGGRFIELKTVQILDRLELEKPCIDAEDECFNTEWSTEFTLLKAWDEYLKAWFALHLLEAMFQPSDSGKSFIFNMSVGYNLEGIKQPPMQQFIDNMMDASDHPKFAQYRDALNKLLQDEAFLARHGLQEKRESLQALPARIPTSMVQGVTLSTMHGCPPHEIEAICRYMLEEKGLNTFVKLNPTLLGYARVREILDVCGFGYIGLKEESFDHDLKLTQALEMLERLMALAKEKSLGFGVKLTNTLGTINNKGALPGEEMYMSGRALFPLSINVAAVLSRAFDGKLPISYSGGASQLTIRDIFDTGIRPITMATDLLKPGGYLRLSACMRELEGSDAWGLDHVDVERLNRLAADALTMEYTQKHWKPEERIEVAEDLPLTDCYVAPCVTACAIKQDIPEYIRLLGEHRYADALELIYQRNALPAITGHICDHQCQYNCTRLDYDSALNIRELKKVALEKGWDEYKQRWHKPAGSGSRHPVAVIGAGPAGLAAGYFLARAGHPVTLFEREANAGGVVKNIIPQFRIPAELIQHDIDFVADHGVKFEYGCSPEYEEALHDGVEFRFLNNPERFDADGTLTLRVMSLGEPDEKGRRRPVETNETVTLHVDSLITAIGEQQDTEALNAMGVPLDKNGWPDVDHNGETRLSDVFMIGDVQRGPSSIVAAVGTARRATDAILSRENIRSHQNDKYWNNVNPAEIYQRKGDISVTLVNSDDRDAFVAQEAARCLECNYVCSKCVDVCPNRANVSIAVPGFQNRFQTLHLDAYCNECGNCAQFCPWNGKPYKDKITVFSLSQDFDNSSNPGFLVEDCRVRVRLNNQSWVLNIDSEGQFNNVPPELNDMCRIISHVHQHHHYLLGRVEV